MLINNLFDSDNLKIPVAAGLIGFILILLINIFVGNSFFVIFTRAFFYSIIVFAVFFGFIFLYRNFINTDIESDDEELKDDKTNVDITVGDDDISEKINSKIKEKIDLNLDNEDLDMDINENIEYEDSKKSDIINNEETESINSKINLDSKSEISDKEKEDFLKTDEPIELNDELSNEEDTSKIDESYSDNSNIDEAHFSLEPDSVKKDDKEIDLDNSLKKKIGVSVSFEEVAKAIRTKLKEDK